MIDNETGKRVEVSKTGEFKKKFRADLTGRYGYHERIARANNVPLN